MTDTNNYHSAKRQNDMSDASPYQHSNSARGSGSSFDNGATPRSRADEGEY